MQATLSRSFLSNTTPDLTNAEIESHIDLVNELLLVSEQKLLETQEETLKDSTLTEVHIHIIHAWQLTLHKLEL